MNFLNKIFRIAIESVAALRSVGSFCVFPELFLSQQARPSDGNVDFLRRDLGPLFYDYEFPGFDLRTPFAFSVGSVLNRLLPATGMPSKIHHSVSRYAVWPNESTNHEKGNVDQFVAKRRMPNCHY